MSVDPRLATLQACVSTQQGEAARIEQRLCLMMARTAYAVRVVVQRSDTLLAVGAQHADSVRSGVARVATMSRKHLDDVIEEADSNAKQLASMGSDFGRAMCGCVWFAVLLYAFVFDGSVATMCRARHQQPPLRVYKPLQPSWLMPHRLTSTTLLLSRLRFPLMLTYSTTSVLRCGTSITLEDPKVSHAKL